MHKAQPSRGTERKKEIRKNEWLKQNATSETTEARTKNCNSGTALEQSVGFKLDLLVPLRKHAYSNVLKVLPPKNENFQIKNSDIFYVSAQNIDCVYSFSTASVRRF